MDSELRDKNVLVTGAAGGIGTAIARALAAEGAHVAVHYHNSEAAAHRLTSELGGRALAARADLRRPDDVDALFAAVIGRLGRLDAIVVNAGIWIEAAIPVHGMPLEQWQHTIESDLTSAFLTCRAFLRHLAAA